jgi:hypothetical protein
MHRVTDNRATTVLQLVSRDCGASLRAELFERGFEAPMPTARPADRCEPWPITERAQVHALAIAAARYGVSLELAAVLVVERALLAGELAEHWRHELDDRLDAEALEARVAVELSEPLSAYLAALSGHTRVEARSLPRMLALPMRLTERILARQGQPQLDAALLTSALAWERAAVLEGRSMSEWAALKALALGS